MVAALFGFSADGCRLGTQEQADEAGHEEEFEEDAAEAGSGETREAHDAAAGEGRGKRDAVRDEEDELLRRLPGGEFDRPLPDRPFDPGPSAAQDGRIVNEQVQGLKSQRVGGLESPDPATVIWSAR